MEWTTGVLAGDKAAGAWSGLLTSIQCWSQECWNYRYCHWPKRRDKLTLLPLSDVHEFRTDTISYSFNVVSFCKGRIQILGFCSGFLGVWTLSVVQYSNEHKVLGTGSVSILMWGDGQWLRLTLSKAVGVSHPFIWGRKQNQLPKRYFFGMPDNGKFPKTY
jgi:hypothetical protein